MNNSNLPQHPCANKCSNFKEEQCNHCLVAQVEKREFELGLAPDEAYVKTTTPELISSDFLIGDAVVLNEVIGNFDEIYNVVEVYENTVDVYIGIGILTLNKKFIRSASTIELNAKRRLTEAEQALAEVP